MFSLCSLFRFNYSSSDSCPGLEIFTGLENSDGWDGLNRWSAGPIVPRIFEGR